MNQLRIMSLLSVVVCILFAAALNAEAAGLTRDLSLGSVGEDVRNLQRFLNTDSATVVASVGVGSVGNESNYFGPATRAAVERFQAKFPDETFKKAGLSAPNGYVGSLTRQAINVRMGYSGSQTTQTYSGSGFVYDPNSTALAPVVVPKYNDPVTTSADTALEAYRRDAAATLARGRVAAIDAIMRLRATTSVATSSVSAADIPRQSSAVSATTPQSTSTEPVIMFVGPRAAEVGDRVNVFGMNIPKDLRIKIGTKTARVKSVTKDGLRAYFTVPRLAEGVYTLEFTSKKESQDLEAPFDEKLSIVDDLAIPRVVSGPDIFTSGETITLEGSNFDPNGETYLNGAFGMLKAISSSESEATFKLPLLKEMLKRDVVIPGGSAPQRSLPFVLSTPAGQTSFVAVVQLR